MALVKFKRGLFANRGTATDGIIYFATDRKELWMATTSGWTKYGDGDERVKDVTYADGAITVSYENGKTSTTINYLASVNDASATNEFVTGISAENGVVTATRSGITASQITRTATTEVQATTVESAIQELAGAVGNANTNLAVTVEKATTAETGYAATYVVKQGGTEVGAKINIPKDYLVKSATLETVATADTPYQGAVVGDKYIDFVVNTTDGSETAQHIYLSVNDLVDVYTANNQGSEVIVAIDGSNNITASVGSIAASKITGLATIATSGLASDAVMTGYTAATVSGDVADSDSAMTAIKKVEAKANSAISAAGVTSAAPVANSYITVDGAGSGTTKTGDITIGTTTVALAGATSSVDGLATANDVKTYVDTAVANKNVSATGDTYVSATASNNAVTIATDVQDLTFTQGSGSTNSTLSGTADSLAAGLYIETPFPM